MANSATMKYYRFILSLFLSSFVLFTCTEEDVISPPVCLLTHYAENYSPLDKDSIIDYTFVLTYDERGRVIDKTYYERYTNYQQKAYHDTVTYEGSRVASIERKLFYREPNTVIAWEFEYTDQYEIVWLTNIPAAGLPPIRKEVVWRDDKGKIVRIESTYGREDYHPFSIASSYIDYTYDNGNLIQKDMHSFQIVDGDTVTTGRQREEWTEHSTVKNPFKGLPFIDLRDQALSDYIPTQYFRNTESSRFPNRIDTVSWQRTYRMNEFGYPKKYLYDCN